MIATIIPSLRCFRAAVESVDAQTVQPDCVHIVLRPGGPGKARNLGVLECPGADYLTFLDDDDTWKPGYIERMVELLQEYDVAICSFDDGNKQVLPPRTNRALYKSLARGAGIAHGSGLTCRASAFALLGGFSEELMQSEVWDFCWRAVQADLDVIAVEERLWYRGTGPDQISRARPYGEIYAERMRIVEKASL